MSIPVSLEGRNALVAGGSGGIGSAVVRKLMTAGVRVASLDRPGTHPAHDTLHLEADLADAAALRGAVGTAAAAFGGRLHVLVHAAGIAMSPHGGCRTEGDWETVLRVNLGSAFLLLRETAPLLRAAGGGSVVLISSIDAARGRRGGACYAASKAGMEGLARSAARELGPDGVRVNAVAPGFIRSPMTAHLPAEEWAEAVDETVLGRIGEPEDVAHAVLFLASDFARHVTGQVLRVDGGQLIG